MPAFSYCAVFSQTRRNNYLINVIVSVISQQYIFDSIPEIARQIDMLDQEVADRLSTQVL